MTLGDLIRRLLSHQPTRDAFKARPYVVMSMDGGITDEEKAVLFTMDRELIADYIYEHESTDLRDEILRFDMDVHVRWADPSPHLDQVTASQSGDDVIIEVTGEGLLDSCEISLESNKRCHEEPGETSGYPMTKFRATNTLSPDPNAAFQSMKVKGVFSNLPPGIDVKDLKKNYWVVVRNAWWSPGHASEGGPKDSKHLTRAEYGWWTKGLRGKITTVAASKQKRAGSRGRKRRPLSRVKSRARKPPPSATAARRPPPT
jgi:hypothetical protein